VYDNLVLVLGIHTLSFDDLNFGQYNHCTFFIRRVIKQTAVIIEVYHFCQPHTKFYPTSFCQG
jgi:hypothetical protein